MPTPEPESLRDVLLRKFGVELPLAGGPGTQAAPIVVTATDLPAAVEVQMLVLRCIGAARRVAWRITAQEVVAGDPKTVQATIETVSYASDEVVTQHEAVHFVLEALPADGTTITLPLARGFVDPRSGVRLPPQLGWLHLGDATDNELDNPGLGFSVAYEAPTMQGTVRVYDQGNRLASDEIESERVIEEFRTAVNDVLDANPDASIKHQALFKEPSGRGRCLLAILNLPGDSMLAVLLSAQAGYFVKATLTFDASEREFGRMAHESMEAFVDAVRPLTTLAS